MELRPLVKTDGRPIRPSAKMGEIYKAETSYRVLSENGNSAAFVECIPKTGLYCVSILHVCTVCLYCVSILRVCTVVYCHCDRAMPHKRNKQTNNYRTDLSVYSGCIINEHLNKIRIKNENE